MNSVLARGRGRAGWIHDYAIRFTARGLLGLEPSFANIEQAAGERADGVLIEVTDDEWKSAIAHEAGYDAIAVTVHGADGQWEGCLTLTAVASERSAERPPSARYARLLARGASFHSLPPGVIARYEGLATTGRRLSARLEGLRAPVVLLAPTLGPMGAVALVGGLTLAVIGAVIWGLARCLGAMIAMAG